MGVRLNLLSGRCLESREASAEFGNSPEDVTKQRGSQGGRTQIRPIGGGPQSSQLLLNFARPGGLCRTYMGYRRLKRCGLASLRRNPAKLQLTRQLLPGERRKLLDVLLD